MDRNLVGKVQDSNNKVMISNMVHRYIHTKLYYQSLYYNLDKKLLGERFAYQAKVILILGKYHAILKGLSDTVKKLLL